MRPVFTREFAELAPLGLAMACIAVFAGIETVSPGQDYDGMLGAAIVFGACVGVVQGGFERWRTGDLFFRHRPVSALRFELARTLAALATVAVAVAVLLVSHRWATADGIESRTAWAYLGDLPRQLTGDETFLLVASALAAWPIVRWGLSRRVALLAIPLAGALALAAWSLVARVSTTTGAAAAALGLAVLFTALQLADAAGGAS